MAAGGSLYPHPVLAREGWVFIALSVLVAAAVAGLAGWAWSIPLWLVAVFIIQFFRDPARTPPPGENLVLAPADGRIVSVERTHDPYLKRDAVRLSVFMNIFNVHSNRSPVDGAVREIWYSAGTFLNAALDKASTGNERNALWLRTERGVDVTCVQVAGLIARRILCYVEPGTQLRRGERFGFIRFGSRVDVYLPVDAAPRARVGDTVYAGASVLAELR
ncbi:MAG: phosphatidylserine decarboxylase [Betaproteobacteria bacterium]|nr:phosphatidylserine decarboxylase [Betaproteobacteria bacterium]